MELEQAIEKLDPSASSAEFLAFIRRLPHFDVDFSVDFSKIIVTTRRTGATHKREGRGRFASETGTWLVDESVKQESARDFSDLKGHLLELADEGVG